MNQDKFPTLKYFDYSHLPADLRPVAMGFHDLAHTAVLTAPNHNPAEIAAGLRKLLEAKDCMVRAHLRS